MKTDTCIPNGHPPTTPSIRFAHRCINSCRRLLARLQKSKSSVLAEFRDRFTGNEHLLELAVNEAEALAWDTGFPGLLFPTLAAEKAGAVAAWQARQQRIREYQPLAAAAA